MDHQQKHSITIETIVNAPVEKVWKLWTLPEHITKWNHASDDWQTTHAENDLKAGGYFSSRMEAKDGSISFDFNGVYDDIIQHELISYRLEDDRKVKIMFDPIDNATQVTETFDAEQENTLELQKSGWQAILDNFKRYVESN